MSVDQVFAILVEFNARHSWAEAFEAVIPLRKYQIGRKGRRGNGGTEEGVQGVREDDHILLDVSGEEGADEDTVSSMRDEGNGAAAVSLLPEQGTMNA